MLALIVSNVAWAALTVFLVVRGLSFYRQAVALADSRETARDQNHREHVRHLEDQIVRLKVDPQQAVTYAAPEADDQSPLPMDDSPYADAMWAEFQEGSKP